MGPSVSYRQLQSEIAAAPPPLVIDVRRRSAFQSATEMISGAVRRDPESLSQWAAELPKARSVVVYCVHGREVSQSAARTLAEQGIAARYLEGGIEEGWKAQGGPLDTKPAGRPATRWVTRERPKIDRIACPWLIARFVDQGAEFLYVPATTVLDAAKRENAVPYDIPDVAFSHVGERCSFDAFLRHYRFTDPALAKLALIVRGADTGKLDLALQAPGLAAISLGLSRNFTEDHEMLAHGMVMYDALYAWCREGEDETRTWKLGAYR